MRANRSIRIELKKRLASNRAQNGGKGGAEARNGRVGELPLDGPTFGSDYYDPQKTGCHRRNWLYEVQRRKLAKISSER